MYRLLLSRGLILIAFFAIPVFLSAQQKASKPVYLRGYFLADFTFGYTWKRFELNFGVENIVNVDWSEPEFDAEARLKIRPEPVSNTYYTPANPRLIKSQVVFRF